MAISSNFSGKDTERISRLSIKYKSSFLHLKDLKQNPQNPLRHLLEFESSKVFVFRLPLLVELYLPP